MIGLGNETKKLLLENGIMEDDIRELEEENKCLFDDENAKIICGIFIDCNVNFKCSMGLDGLHNISLVI